MQRSLNRFSRRLIPPACRHPTNTGGRCYLRPRCAVSGNEYLVGSRGVVCLWNSHRNYTIGGVAAAEEDRSPSGGGKKRKRLNARHGSVLLNRNILFFGQRGLWEEILRLVDREKNNMDHINWATAFVQLGRIITKSGDDLRHEPSFGSFANEYADRLRGRGLSWAGIRQLGGVVHAIGKARLKIPATGSILAFVLEPENARRIVREGQDTQAVANTAWSLATLGVSSSGSAAFLAEVENHADWLVANGTTQEAANAAWAFATLGIPCPKLFAAIENRAGWLLTNGTTQEAANTAWAFAKLAGEEEDPPNNNNNNKFFAALENRIDWLVSNGTPQEVANVAWAFATRNARSPKLVAAIGGGTHRAERLVANAKPQEIASVAWAFAKLNANPPALFAAIENRADWLATNGTPQAVANTGWAFAKLNIPAPRLFEAIENRAAWLVANGTPQEVANIAWAFAKLGVACPQLFAEIGNRTDWLVTNGTPQGVANIAWALGKQLGKTTTTASSFDHEAFLAAIEDRADWLIKNGQLRAVGQIVWACSQLDWKAPALLAKLETFADRLVKNARTPQEVSNTAWALAQLNAASPRFFRAVQKRADWLVDRGTTRNVAQIAWSFVKLDVKHPPLFSAIEARAEWLVQNATRPQHVAEILAAAGRFQYRSPRLLQEANARSAWLVNEGSIQSISNASTAFAGFGCDAPAFFEAAADNASRVIADGSPHDIIAVCYSMAILDLGTKHPDAFGRLWDAAIHHQNSDALRNEELVRLGRVLVFGTASGAKLPPPSALLAQKIRDAVALPEEVLPRRPKHHYGEAAAVPRPRHHGEVAAFLDKLGVEYDEDVSPLEGSDVFTGNNSNGGVFSIDFACKRDVLAIDETSGEIICKRHRVAIECDGKSGFLRDLDGIITQEANGLAKAKHRFLERTGWTVVPVYYRDWLRAKEEDSQLEFLRGELNRAGLQLK